MYFFVECNAFHAVGAMVFMQLEVTYSINPKRDWKGIFIHPRVRAEKNPSIDFY